MKKLFLALVVILALLVMSTPAFAGRYDREDAVNAGWVDVKIERIDGTALTAATYIHAITICPTAANAVAIIANGTTTLSNLEEGEISQPTSGLSTRHVYDRPLNYDSGVTIDVTNCDVILEYRE